MNEYSVTDKLPMTCERVMCFGYAVHGRLQDMAIERAWHKVVFDMHFSEFKLKLEVPKDPSESIFEFCHYRERWRLEGEEDLNARVIGVTKWKKM